MIVKLRQGDRNRKLEQKRGLKSDQKRKKITPSAGNRAK